MSSLVESVPATRREVPLSATEHAAYRPYASVRTAVVGVSGYGGGELASLLLRHPRLSSSVPLFCKRSGPDRAGTGGTTLEEVHPQLAGATKHAVVPFSWTEIERAGTEVLFLATPHEQSRAWVPEALARGLRVIDLSGAWRLRDSEHRAPYGFIDSDPHVADLLQSEAVYGCPELHGDAIRDARLVANPGCYATSIILALAPLLRAGVIDLQAGIVCDAKSGVSGAGKAATATTHFMHAADNLSAYAVFGHRHLGELLEQLSLSREQIRFTPHLLPIPRGILASIYLRLNAACSAPAIHSIFSDFYRGRHLVRVRDSGDLPQIQHVVRTNFCDVGFELDRDGRRLFVVSCLDNLLKGAAAQAVQNMNLMCGWDETEGLR